MKRFVLLTEKSWHAELFENLSSRKDEDWILINTKSNFAKDKLDEISPAKIFIPHWSHIIQSDIFESYDCIVFHMTDLPYGRGGSPLQNLIVRGHNDTMISALIDLSELIVARLKCSTKASVSMKALGYPSQSSIRI